eukprot:CAMPEP_0115837962 /NCGR_PEP_ID=MMETSP0287-20121206/5486_1 /TAXON_ID=412157 /ORGANISM="Chrysochromulina rotalis, Strain UIO044" /LENGTH=149 /DNA_ID=CAMNT_0003291479 /DNA_START=104 /DNA_END=549 /DNA_ORIENTATION=+
MPCGLQYLAIVDCERIAIGTCCVSTRRTSACAILRPSSLVQLYSYQGTTIRPGGADLQLLNTHPRTKQPLRSQSCTPYFFAAAATAAESPPSAPPRNTAVTAAFSSLPTNIQHISKRRTAVSAHSLAAASAGGSAALAVAITSALSSSS